MKNIFKIESVAFSIDGNPIELKGLEFETEASAQELATVGGNINNLVELIGDIAERFDNNTPIVKEIKVEPVKVKEPITDFREVNEKTEKPELPTATFRGGEPKKNLTKEWRKISIPKSLSKIETDRYHWSGNTPGETITVDGTAYGVVYLHINAMKKHSFVIVRTNKVEYEDDIKSEDFQDFLSTINIPGDIKEYIRKVVEL